MDLLDVGSLVTAIQHIRDEKERESWGVLLLSTWAVNAPISFFYSLGMGLQTKSAFFKWMGYCFTHLAGTIYKTSMLQTFTHRIVVAAPMDLVNNTALLDSIHVEQIVNKGTA